MQPPLTRSPLTDSHRKTRKGSLRTSTRNLTGLSLAVTLVLASCGQGTVTNSQGAIPGSQAGSAASFVLDPTHAFVAGQLVVGLQDGRSAQDAARLIGGQVLSELPTLNAAVLSLPSGLPVAKAIRMMASSGQLRYAEPNYLMSTPERLSHTPQNGLDASVSTQAVQDSVLNDPQLGKQWFLNNMGAYKAWETATGKGIRIGVADEDIDRNHPDLKANISFPGFDAPNNKVITADTPYDGSGEHGTWVSGTAAAVGNNGIGGAGVAYQASIVPLTITHDPAGASNVDSSRAFIWAVNGPDGIAPGAAGDTDTPAGHKGFVDIVNYSFGGTGYSQLSKEAIDYVLSKGVVFVTSAGNTPTTGPASPAWTPGAISVAATTPRNVRTDFSNRGAHLSVAAPGQQVWVTAVRKDVTNPNEVNYEYVDGTSFASPATAGAAALILQASATKNPDGSIKAITLTPGQVRHILEDTAFKAGVNYNIDTGNGIVRADAAVLRATQNAAATVEKGVNVSLKFVADSDNTLGIPLVGATLSGGKRPEQLLYAQSAAGDGAFAAGVVSFREIDAGDYQLYASGPRTVLAGGTPGLLGTTLSLAPGRAINATVPLTVTFPTDASEPNDTLATATPIAYGNVKDGVLPSGDVDLFKFAAVQGETAFINTKTVSGAPNTNVQVLDATGKVLAENDNQRSDVLDAALDFPVPASGDYYIRVNDKTGGTPFNAYFVSLSRLVGKESEPNGSATVTGEKFGNIDFSKANPLAIGQALDAAIDPANDVDIYTFTGVAGQNIVADMNAVTTSKPDGVMSLYQAGNPVALSAIDDTNTTDPTVEYSLPANGTYYLVVASYTTTTQASSGPYRVSLNAR
ncbi:S8 family serine peptidase [Deinococcus altitudinis]|uniref:S8 family serine peptidase n=1 Tax=Deinococcus altitudinis TaxID=468914 RepID=UPI00389129C5